MADEDIKPDVSTGTAITVATPEQATALARAMGGELPPNRGLFWCMTCGFEDAGKSKYPRGLTIEFEDEELAALGGDPYRYGGPCPVCDKMTLVNMALMGEGNFTVRRQAAENRKKDYGEAADVFIDKVSSRIGDIMTGGMVRTDGSQTPQQDRPVAPGQRDDLPNADDVGIEGLTPRKS